MYLITKGKVINPESGLAISKNMFYKKGVEEVRYEIVAYPISDDKRMCVLSAYADESKRDRVFDSFVDFLRKREDVFDLIQ